MRFSKSVKSIELFTGAGGLAIATHDAGCDHKALVEWEENACDTLRVNSEKRKLFAENVIQCDIRKLEFDNLEGVDLVAGGPPCQPFSLGGKHKGFDDHRDMIPEFARAVRELLPKAFIMENVKGLLRTRFKN